MQEALPLIFKVIIFPLLAALTGFAIRWINVKTEQLKVETQKTNDVIVQKYLTRLNETITDAIIATNQTYVNTLKEKNAFNKEAQIEAFNRTYENVKAIITTDMEDYLQEMLGDLETYITTRIEAEIGKAKA